MDQKLKKQILEGTVQVFNEKGPKFTMDDIAKKLGISKKTIYTVFDTKQEMFVDVVDYLFDAIKEEERKVVEDPSLSTYEKIKKILGVLPNSYAEIDFRQMYLFKDKHPEAFKKVEERLETGWESTIALLEQGMKEGVIRPIRIPILKMMLEASIEQFLQKDTLLKSQISYQQGLEEVVEILVDGIIVKK